MKCIIAPGSDQLVDFENLLLTCRIGAAWLDSESKELGKDFSTSWSQYVQTAWRDCWASGCPLPLKLPGMVMSFKVLWKTEPTKTTLTALNPPLGRMNRNNWIIKVVTSKASKSESQASGPQTPGYRACCGSHLHVAPPEPEWGAA